MSYLPVDSDCFPSGKRSFIQCIILHISLSLLYHKTSNTILDINEIEEIITKTSNIRSDAMGVEKITIVKEQKIENKDNPIPRKTEDVLPRSNASSSISFTKYTTTLCVFGVII